MDVAALHAQVDGIHGREALEFLGQILRLEDEFAHGLHRWLRDSRP